MAKDPAFLFYPNDWLGGTMTLTRHQKGCYIDLLIAQFNIGPLSLETIKTVLGQDQATWTVLSSKFKKDSAGNFFNERLATEIEKRAKFSQSRRENVNKRYQKNDTLVSTHVEHMNLHMEDRNRNENRNKKIKGVDKKNKKPPPLNFGVLQNDFAVHWQRWIQYKSEQFSQKYKSQTTEQQAINQLIELSGGDPITAEIIIRKSISNLWKGLFKIQFEKISNNDNNDSKKSEPNFNGVSASSIRNILGRPSPLDIDGTEGG